MSDYNINNAKNDIQHLQSQNKYDFQEIKRLDRLINDYNKRVLEAINFNNQINKKIQDDYENIKKIIIDENASAALDKKIDDKYNSNKNKIEEIQDKQLNNSIKILDVTNKVTDINSQLETKALKIDLETEKNRIDNLIIHSGEGTEKDSELIDGRIGIDGTSFSLIGDNIRVTNKNVNSLISNVFNFKNELIMN